MSDMNKENLAGRDLKAKLHRYFIEKTDFISMKDRLNEEQLRSYVSQSLDDLCRAHKIDLPENERLVLVREIVGSAVSLGPLRPLVEDESISEIMVNGPHQIYIQRAGLLEVSDVVFENHQQLMHTVHKMLAASGTNRRVDESNPYVDFSMPDGSRVNVILPPVSLVGPVITIRKFSSEIETVDDLVERDMLSKEMAALLTAAIKAKLNIVFCGATGTGKTTTLNVLSRHVPDTERIVTIEDTAELRLRQRHVVSLQTKPMNVEGKGAISIRDLFVNSLRMRPDRIILGEVRGSEALDLIQSISSGHTGSLAILHADSPQDCFNRMVTLILMSGVHLSLDEIKRQVARAIDMIVHVELFIDGRRRITNVTDLRHSESGEITFKDVFTFEQEKVEQDNRVIGQWKMNKETPSFYGKLRKRNVALPPGFFKEGAGE